MKLASVNQLIVLFFSGLICLSGCTRTPEWSLFYIAEQQPLPSQPLQAQFIAGYYDTLSQCQAKGAGLLRLQSSTVKPADGFVCGQQCKVNEQDDIECLQSVSGVNNAPL